MPGLTCVPIATPRASVRASLADDRSSPSIPHVKVDPKPSSPRIRTTPTPRGSKQKKSQKQQPTIVEIERAIGAGRFSDADPKKLEQRKSVLDGVLPTDGWKVESSVERKLRESGEWILDRTERRPASAGKSILIAVFQWVLPAWVLMLLVASGAVKLPFRVTFLDDLIMIRKPEVVFRKGSSALIAEPAFQELCHDSRYMAADYRKLH